MITVAHEERAVTVTPRNRANFRRLKTNSIQSYKRWEKENELLYAMMEDESEWLAKLFPDVVISPDFFFYALEDGSLLCRLANYIQEKAETYSRERKIPVPGKKFRYHTMGKCNKEIKLFKSRENVQQFLTWCRNHGIPEAILFESNDVVQVDDYREGCRGIIICLMEIVRRTAKFELDELPQLIQMEKEIEEDEAMNDTDVSDEQGQILNVEQINMSEFDNLEVQQTDQPEIQSPSSLDSDSGVDSVFDQEEGDSAASRLTEFSVEEETTKATAVVGKQTSLKPKDRKSCPKIQKKTDELPSLLDSKGPKSELDKQVCKLAQDYDIKVVHRLKEGKYIILGRIMFVRMLNDHMLVRIGGGWDTLEHYLMTHVPSKQALENSSATPSSQSPTSPRNSISTGTGCRKSLFDKVKRKEQIGVISRDSPVYSSQGSLSHPLASQSTPNLREKSKKLSVVESDKKDITDAIRKIESSVSQNLASRPVSFTSKTFHQLKSRFDKGIFGSSRRTSSPDLSVKGKRILRRLSDTSAMADIATTLSFDRMNEDQQQITSANNNDADLKQPESGDEAFPGKTTAPREDLLGNETQQSNVMPPEQIAMDETDSSESRGDLPSTDHANDSNWTGDLIGGPVNGSENLQHDDQGKTSVDVSSFDPLAPTGEQDQLISTENVPSEVIEERPKAADDVEDDAVVGNGHLELESVPGIVHETAEMHDELITMEADDSALELTPRIDLGDLLADSQPVEQVTPESQESTVESSPPFELGDPRVDTKSMEAEKEGDFVEPSPTEYQISEVEATNPFEEVTSDNRFEGKDVQDVPSIEIDPVEESPNREEATQFEEPARNQESAVNSEGEITTPVLDEITSEEQSQKVVEFSYLKEDESMEETSNSKNEVSFSEEEAKPAELEATPMMEEAKSVEAEVDTVGEEAKIALEDVHSVEEESTPTSEEVTPVEVEAKVTEEEVKSLEKGVKPLEIEARPADVEMKTAEEEDQPSEEEVKPVQKEAKPAEVYAFMFTDEGVAPVEEETKSTEEEVKSLEEGLKALEIETMPAEIRIKTEEEEGKGEVEDVRSIEDEVKPVEKEAKPVNIYALIPTDEGVTPVEEEAKPSEEEVKPSEEEVKPSEEEVKPSEEEVKPSEEEVKPVEKEAKPAKIHALPTEKKTGNITKTKPQSAGVKSAKSPTKATPSTGPATAKKQPGATKPLNATSKKDVKAPATKVPASKPSVATKAPAAKSTATSPGTKKPAGKTAASKVDETKKPERPKSAATARSPTKSSVTSTTRPVSAVSKKVPASTTKPPARKTPGVDSTDSGTPKSASKTSAGRPASSKLTQVRTSSPATKPTATKPSRPQSAKPSDKPDGATKTPTSRPQSAKPKTTTTTTTTVKKTTTTTKTGIAPMKTTTTKTVKEVKNGPVKTSTTTTRPTKPSSTPKTAAKPTTTNLKSKPGVKTSTAGAKPSTKAPPMKKEDEAKDKQKQIKLDEPESKEEKIVELVATEKQKPPEIVEAVSEERPIEGSPEEKLIELTPVSAYEQAPQSVEVSSKGVVTQIVSSQTTTVVEDGEEQTTTTTTEETAFEQFEGES